MINILHIGMTDNPGGLESYILNHFKYMDKTKFKFSFLYYKGEKMAYEDEILEMGGEIFHIIHKRKDPQRFLKPIIKFLKTNKFDIVHYHKNNLYDLDYLWMSKLAGINHRIVHAHSSGYITQASSVIKLVEKINYTYLEKVATNLAACSQSAGQWMFGERDFTKLTNAIDLEKFRFDENSRTKIRERYKIKDSDIVLGHIGSFYDVKNQGFLIDILNELKKRNSYDNHKLMLIGDGENFKKVANKVEKYQLDSEVLLLGKQKNASQFYSAFDCFLFPSKFEGLGMVAIEAQANGLSTIISSGVPDDVLIADNTYKLNNFNAKAWADFIVKLELKRLNSHDKLVDAGYEISHQVKNLEKYYRDIMKGEN